MATEFAFEARSDVGLLRNNNQDSAYASANLLAVADGMGGAAGGDIASSVVIAHLAPLGEASGTANTMLVDLTSALQVAHDELVERSSNDRKLRGLGTTCTAILRSGNKLAMVHIGDSRAYLLRDGVLTQVTNDHSFVQYLIDTGQITKEEAETHPKRNYILRVLGDTPGDVAVDETVREAVIGDRWLLCSDGLSGVVSDDTLAEVLKDFPDLSQCADKLIELALLGGGPDNITCVLADVVDSTDTRTEAPVIVGAAAVDRNAPSKGTSGAAGRAAALAKQGVDNPTDEGEDEPENARRRFWLGPLLLILAVLGLVGGSIAGWQWSQTQYYVQGTDGNVVIYQGIPQAIGPWEFSHPIEITDIRLDSLSEVDRIRLDEPVVRASLDQVETYLDEIRARGKKEEDKRKSSSSAQSGQTAQSGGATTKTDGDTTSDTGDR